MSDWRNILPLIINKIKYQFFSRKMDNLDKVSAIFRQADMNKDGIFSKSEFNKLLARIGIFLTTQELTAVYTAFDLNQDGKVSFIEFMSSIRNEISDTRIRAVKATFMKLDKQGKGQLSLPFLITSYCADLHPRVRTREKTVELVCKEFEEGISKKSKDGATISELEFLDYYADVSACLPAEREDHFLDILEKSWMSVNHVSKVKGDRVLDIEMRVFEKVRQKTVGTDNEGVTLRKKFAYVDRFGLGIIDFLQFKQAMHEIGCCFSDEELQALFWKYSDGKPKLVYSEVCDYFKDLGVGAQPNLNPTYTLYRSVPEGVIENIRSILANRGVLSYGKFRKIFKIADKDNSNFLSRDEFVWSMKENGISMTKNDYLKVFRFFDKNFDNQISYQEFIEFFVGILSDARLQLINHSFTQLLTQGQECLDYLRVAQAYDPKNDPEIRAGYVTKNQQLNEFISLFPNKGIINRSDWIAVFTDISANFHEDEAFASYVNNMWTI